MVDLPTYRPEDVTAEAPQARVSGFDVARSTDYVAQGLQQLGKGVGDLATTEATQEGQQAAQEAVVTRGPDGTPQVQPKGAMILGPAGDAYAQAVHSGLIAKLQSSVDTDLADMHARNLGDPLAFQNEAGAYITALGPNLGSDLGAPTQEYAARLAAQHYSGLVDTNARLDIQASFNAIKARRSDLEDQMDGMAADGGDGTPAFQALRRQHDELGNQLAANPLSGYNADQKAVDDGNFDTQLKASAFTGLARRAYLQSGNAAATIQKFNTDIDTLPLSEAEKLRYQGEIFTHIQGLDAVNQQQTAQLKDQAASLTQTMKATGAVDDTAVETLARQLEVAKGGMAAAAALRGEAISTHYTPAIMGGTAQEAATALAQLRTSATGGSAPAAVPLTPQERDLAIRTIAGEAGGESDEGQAGVAAVIRNRVMSGTYGKTAAEVMLAPKQFSVWNPGDPAGNIARDLPAYSAQYQSIGKIVDGIFGGTIPDPTNGADHYYNPNVAAPAWGDQLAMRNDVMIGNHRFVGGVGSTETPTQIAFRIALNEQQKNYDTHTATLWAGIKDAYDKGEQPSPQELDDLRTMVPFTGDQKLRDDIAKTMDVQNGKTVPPGTPLAAQQNAVAAGQLAAQQGQVSALGRKVIAGLADDVKFKTALAAASPVDYAQRYIPAPAAKALPPVAPLDLSNPANLSAGLKARQAWKGAAQAMDPAVGNMPLTTTDRQQIASTLPTANGQQAQAILGSLANTLRPDELGTLFDDKDMSGAVTGLTRSGDASKMDAAYSFLDAQYRQNPAQFQKNFGDDTFKGLREWQSYSQYLPPDQIAQKMMRANDPSQQTARDMLAKQADDDLKSVTPDKVVGSLTKTPGPFGLTMPFTGAAAPQGLAGATLLAQYRDAYKDFYSDTGDKNGAAKFANEKIGQRWGASPANGGRFMQFPPERFYPPVNGSQDWIGKQLDDDVRQHFGDIGQPYAQGPGGIDYNASTDAERAALAQYKAPRQLVPDRQTEADISNGRPPSYQIIIQNSDGSLHQLQNPTGQPLRFRPDAAAAVSASETQFTQDRAANAPRIKAEADRRAAISAGRIPAFQPAGVQ